MAPDAPPPVYDTQGNLALGWLIVTRYDPADGAVVLSWSKDGDLFRKSRHGAVGYTLDDLERVPDDFRSTLRMLSDPSLF